MSGGDSWHTQGRAAEALLSPVAGGLVLVRDMHASHRLCPAVWLSARRSTSQCLLVALVLATRKLYTGFDTYCIGLNGTLIC